MAILKFGSLLSGLRGSVGGTVFSHSHAGPYVRLSYRPVNSRSNSQSQSRSLFARLPGLWRSLSGEEKALWIAYAADPAQVKYNSLAEEYFASGFNWFCAINSSLARAGLALRDSPPENPAPDIPVITEFSAWVFDPPFSTAVITIDPSSWSNGNYLWVSCSFVPRGGHTVAHSGFFLMVVDECITPPYLYDLGFAPQDKFGLAVPGDQIFVRASQMSLEGRRSADAQTFAVYQNWVP